MSNYKDFTKLDLTKVNVGDKITVIKQSDFGYPINIQLKLESIKLRDYAQYTNCIEIVGRSPRKRTSYRYIITPIQDFTIVEGFQVVNDTAKVITDGDVKITNLGLCFSTDTLRRASALKNVLISTFNI